MKNKHKSNLKKIFIIICYTFYFIFWYQMIKILHMGIFLLHKWINTGKMCKFCCTFSFLILRSAKITSHTCQFSKIRSNTTTSITICDMTQTWITNWASRCMVYWIWKGWILPRFSNFTIAPDFRGWKWKSAKK